MLVNQKQVVGCYEAETPHEIEEAIEKEMEGLQSDWGWSPIVIHQSIATSAFYAEGHHKRIVALVTYADAQRQE